jgi:hypothetical protein
MSNDRFAVSVKDAAGAYVRANAAFTNLLGVSSADLPGLTDDHVQPRDVAESLVANDRAALAAAGPLLVEEQVFDRLGLRRIAACRFTTEEDGRTLVWRVSGPVQQAAEISAEAERLRQSVAAPEQSEDEPVPAPVAAPVPAPPVAAAPAPVADDSTDRIARLEAELAELRSRAALPDPRMQAALRALAGVAEALEEPMRVAPAFRAAAERLAGALGFDAAITWRPSRDGGLVCSSVWTANPEARAFEDECWRTRQMPPRELVWNPDAAEPNGMRTVVSIPIGDAGAMEFLAVERRELEAETLQALDAAARQLRLVARLTELADLPRWASIASNATA